MNTFDDFSSDELDPDLSKRVSALLSGELGADESFDESDSWPLPTRH
jgi:hypothetical protein